MAIKFDKDLTVRNVKQIDPVELIDRRATSARD
jgi:hypothetical protein